MTALPGYTGSFPKPNQEFVLAYINSLADSRAKSYATDYWAHLLTGSAQPPLGDLTYSQAQQIRLKLATLI